MFTTLDGWLHWQESLHPQTIDLGLERVQRVAQAMRLGRFTCPVVTVAGTNGKGSCVAFLEALLAASGRRVGAFTSPHLIRYNERIRVAGAEASDQQIVSAFERIERARGGISLTFFEFNTLAALAIFQDASLDAVILEVGLGGRLDAVNIVDADVAVLTRIGLDHCDWLGPTVEDIGREKAGILRRGRPAILGDPEMPQSVFEVAAQTGAVIRLAGRDFGFRRAGDRWSWFGSGREYTDLPLPALPGAHQLANATMALAALAELAPRLPLTPDQVAAGLCSATLHGRFEVIRSGSEWILDVAHNPDAAANLAANLARSPAPGRTLAIVGVLRDKDVAGVVAPLANLVHEWIATTLPGMRGLTAAQLVERCRPVAGGHWSESQTVAEACVLAARRAGPDDRIVVFGSFHTVGPALEWLGERTGASDILPARGG